jgi:hypothetical protein
MCTLCSGESVSNDLSKTFMMQLLHVAHQLHSTSLPEGPAAGQLHAFGAAIEQQKPAMDPVFITVLAVPCGTACFMAMALQPASKSLW